MPSFLIALTFLVALSLLAACSTPISGADSGPDAASVDAPPAIDDAGNVDAVEGGRCVEASASLWALESYDDVSVRYAARISPDIEERPFDLLLEMRRFAMSEFTGTFPLGTGPEENFASCARCVSAFFGTTSDRGYFAASGTLSLDVSPFDLELDLVLEDVTLIEVTIGDDLTSTPVAAGDCIHFARVEVQRTFGPPGWTCAEAEYGDGIECDCECGILDPDCGASALPIARCAPGELCLPLARGVIGPFFGDSVCAADCDRAAGRYCPGGQACVDHAFGDLCIAEPGEIDRAADLGEACAAGALYCAIDAMGLANGLCDHFSVRADGTCRPRCSVDSDCNLAASEVCYVTGADTSGGTERPFGYCALRHPADWSCAPAAYDENTRCDCECGPSTDPDCYDPSLPIAGCEPGETCGSGTCA